MTCNAKEFIDTNMDVKILFLNTISKYVRISGLMGFLHLRIGVYIQTSLIRASLIRTPHNPNTVPGSSSISFSIYNDIQ